MGRFWGDEAVCRAMWLGRRLGRFVPQGLAVDRGRIDWFDPRATDGLWVTISKHGCGVLVGPADSASRSCPAPSVPLHYDDGDRVIPQLVRYAVEDLAAQTGLKGGERRVRRCLS